MKAHIEHLSLVAAFVVLLAPGAVPAAQETQAAATAGAQTEAERKLRAAHRRADRQLMAWATEPARETLAPLLAAKAADAATLLLEGRLLEQEGKADEAARAFQAAANAARRDTEPHLYLGAYHARADRTENATAHFKAAHARAKRLTVREPENAEAFTAFGRALQALDRLDEATAAYQKAIELEGDNALAGFYLGTIHYRQARYPDALASFDRVLAGHPYLAHAYFYRGITYSKLGKKPLMAADLDRFVAMAPEAPEAATARALLRSVR